MQTTAPPTFPMPRAHPLDPPPEYARFRAEQPMVKVRTPRGDAWLVTRHADVRAALTDRRLSSDPWQPGYPSYLTGDVPPPPGFFMQLDAPDHARLRRMVSREFQINNVEALRPSIQRIVDGVLDDMLALTPPVDFVQVVALPTASLVICELLGVPYTDHTVFQSLTNAVLDRSRPAGQTEAAAVQLMAYFDRLVTTKEQDPGDDLLSRLIAGRADPGELTHEELVGVAALLLLAGYDTMAQIIGLGVLTFSEHPDQLARLRADPVLVGNAVEELLRYLTVNHAGLPRAAVEDLTIGGQLIGKGEGVLVMLNSANRDEEVFAQPDAFDIERPARHHVGFGYGLHKCIGTTLARVELQVVFSTLFQRVPTLRSAVSLDQLRFRHEMVLYGLHGLPVAW